MPLIYLPKFFKVTSLTQRQLSDSPCASEAAVKTIDKTNWDQTMNQHNKA